MPQSAFPFSDWPKDLLSEDPRLAYYSQLYGQNLNPLQQNYFQGQYNDIFSQYLGRLGQGLMGAQQQGQSLPDYLAQPQGSFLDFLQEKPFTQRFAQTPPQMRPGSSRSRFAPNVRWLV